MILASWRLRKRTLASQQKMEEMNRRHVIAGAAMAAGALALPALAREDIARSLLERFAATLSSHDIAAFAALFADDYVVKDWSSYFTFFTSPFFTPASGKIHIATTINMAVTMM